MKILITGSNGRLGFALQEVFAAEQLFLTNRAILDLTSFQDTAAFFRRINPNLVIHCAAKATVDECELYPDEAYRANVIVTKNVVNACQMVGAELVYISTDHVFDGQSQEPYKEYDICNPLNVYGRTKLMGENIVTMHNERFYIVRTSWLFSDTGNNFIRFILQLAKNNQKISIINNQIGSPTYTLDLAKAIGELIATDAFGVYHITNDGWCSWMEWAKTILKVAGKNQITVEAQPLDHRPARRPPYSVLARAGLDTLGITMPDYHDALTRYFERNDL